MPESRQADLNAALLEAIAQYRADTCRDLLRAGADPNADVGSDGDVMLTHSIQNGDVATTLCLLEHGALPTAKSIEHEVPLIVAAHYSTVTHARILLEHGARVDEMTRRSTLSALQVAAQNGDEKLCRVLIDAGAELSRTSQRGFSALHCAVASFADTSLCTARVLVAAGADINLIALPPPPILNPQHLSPFQDAVLRGHLEHVIFFVEECGADLGQRTHAGQTLLELTKFLDIKAYLRSAMVEKGIDEALGEFRAAGPCSTTSRTFTPL